MSLSVRYRDFDKTDAIYCLSGMMWMNSKNILINYMNTMTSKMLANCLLANWVWCVPNTLLWLLQTCFSFGHMLYLNFYLRYIFSWNRRENNQVIVWRIWTWYRWLSFIVGNVYIYWFIILIKITAPCRSESRYLLKRCFKKKWNLLKCSLWTSLKNKLLKWFLKH